MKRKLSSKKSRATIIGAFEDPAKTLSGKVEEKLQQGLRLLPGKAKALFALDCALKALPVYEKYIGNNQTRLRLILELMRSRTVALPFAADQGLLNEIQGIERSLEEYEGEIKRRALCAVQSANRAVQSEPNGKSTYFAEMAAWYAIHAVNEESHERAEWVFKLLDRYLRAELDQAVVNTDLPPLEGHPADVTQATIIRAQAYEMLKMIEADQIPWMSKDLLAKAEWVANQFQEQTGAYEWVEAASPKNRTSYTPLDRLCNDRFTDPDSIVEKWQTDKLPRSNAKKPKMKKDSVGSMVDPNKAPFNLTDPRMYPNAQILSVLLGISPRLGSEFKALAKQQGVSAVKMGWLDKIRRGVCLLTDSDQRLYTADCVEMLLPLWTKFWPNGTIVPRMLRTARDFANGLLSTDEVLALEAKYRQEANVIEAEYKAKTTRFDPQWWGSPAWGVQDAAASTMIFMPGCNPGEGPDWIFRNLHRSIQGGAHNLQLGPETILKWLERLADYLTGQRRAEDPSSTALERSVIDPILNRIGIAAVQLTSEAREISASSMKQTQAMVDEDRYDPVSQRERVRAAGRLVQDAVRSSNIANDIYVIFKSVSDLCNILSQGEIRGKILKNLAEEYFNRAHEAREKLIQQLQPNSSYRNSWAVRIGPLQYEGRNRKGIGDPITRIKSSVDAMVRDPNLTRDKIKKELSPAGGLFSGLAVLIEFVDYTPPSWVDII